MLCGEKWLISQRGRSKRKQDFQESKLFGIANKASSLLITYWKGSPLLLVKKSSPYWAELGVDRKKTLTRCHRPKLKERSKALVLEWRKYGHRSFAKLRPSPVWSSCFRSLDSSTHHEYPSGCKTAAYSPNVLGFYFERWCSGEVNLIERVRNNLRMITEGKREASWYSKGGGRWQRNPCLRPLFS